MSSAEAIVPHVEQRYFLPFFLGSPLITLSASRSSLCDKRPAAAVRVRDDPPVFVLVDSRFVRSKSRR